MSETGVGFREIASGVTHLDPGATVTVGPFAVNPGEAVCPYMFPVTDLLISQSFSLFSVDFADVKMYAFTIGDGTTMSVDLVNATGGGVTVRWKLVGTQV